MSVGAECGISEARICSRRYHLLDSDHVPSCNTTAQDCQPSNFFKLRKTYNLHWISGGSWSEERTLRLRASWTFDI